MSESFSQTYAEARRRFLAAAADAGARVESHVRNGLAGADGEELACDVAVLGAETAPAASIVVCGTHGAEGYCGSAILHRWLRGRVGRTLPKPVKAVLVHAINPWAFSHKTRTSETNVDLNRNFLPPGASFHRLNPSYDKVAPFLHASARDAAQQLSAYRAYRSLLDREGPDVETASLEGQSAWPDGLYHIGRKPEWSNTLFRALVRRHLSDAVRIGFIDWHTGVGQYGEMAHLVFDPEDSPAYNTAARWWQLGPGHVPAFQTGSLPAYSGLLCSAIRQELPRPAIAGAVIEFGTGDDFSVFRGDILDRWLRFEGRTDPEHRNLREDYLRACCPADVAWRRFVLDAGPGQIDRMVDGLAALW